MKDQTLLLDFKPLFDRYASLQEHHLSAFHFSAIFAWAEFFDFDFEIIDDRLCIFAQHEPGTFLYLPPLGGPFYGGTLKKCFDRMGTTSMTRRVARIENIDEETLKILPDLGFTTQAKSSEYVYLKKDIAELSGAAYKSQRHDVNHLCHHCKPVVQEYHDGHFDGCVELLDQWAAHRLQRNSNDIYRAMLDDNLKVHPKLLQHHRGLGLIGRVVLIENKVRAYSFGYPLNSSTFCVLLEVTDLNITGLSAFIFKQFCLDPVWDSFTLVNTMDDFGMPNIAKAKTAYHPSHFIRSYTLYSN